MRLKFDTAYRALLALLVFTLLCAVWSDAAEAVTNAAAATPPATKEAAQTGTNEMVLITFGLDQFDVLKERLFGIPRWQFLASLVYIALAFAAARLMDFLFSAVLKKWASRTDNQYDDLLVDLLKGPVQVVAFVILLHVGFNMFDWPDWMERYSSRGLKLVVAWSFTLMALRAVEVLMRWLRDRATDEDRAFDAQLYPVLSKGLKIFIVIIALLVTAQNLDLNITGLLASLSIGGLAIGLAAQDTLANLFGAVAIFADKPFHLGERIRIDSHEGVVEKIGLRSTRIRNADGHLIAIPNKIAGQAVIVNIARRPNLRTVMILGLTYSTTPAKMRRALALLEEIYRAHPQTHDVWAHFRQFADSSLNIELVHWWKDTGDFKAHLAGMQELHLQVMERFEREGLEFAFPTRTIYLKQEPATAQN